jgi:hypothetical protein
MLQGVLDRVVDVYESVNVYLPERRYWTLASTPADCEQVVVIFLQAYLGPPGDQATKPQRCDGPMTASIQVQITRCIPTISAKGRPPTLEQIQAGAEPLVIDAYMLLRAAGDLEQWDQNEGFGLGVIATVDAGEPQGGFQAVTMNISMAIP